MVLLCALVLLEVGQRLMFFRFHFSFTMRMLIWLMDMNMLDLLVPSRKNCFALSYTYSTSFPSIRPIYWYPSAYERNIRSALAPSYYESSAWPQLYSSDVNDGDDEDDDDNLGKDDLLILFDQSL
jgi:hypothetical protein